MMRSQQGVTLIELMVALTLGTILTAGVVGIFISSKQSYTVVVSQSQAQESARVVKHFIGRALRHAGYWDDPTSLRSFQQTTAGGGLPENAVLTVADDDSTEAAIVDGTDSLTVRFSGTADGSVSTCLGLVPSATEMAVDRYYIGAASGSAQVSGLVCASEILNAAGAVARSSTQTLVTGVENLQFELGIGDTGSLSRYFAPSSVSDWENVKAARYAVLTTSNQNASGSTDARNYTLLGSSTVTAPADARVRRVQRETVYLRNYREN